jgi:hypothetical protein
MLSHVSSGQKEYLVTPIYFCEAFPPSSIDVNNSVNSALGPTFPYLLVKVTPTGGFCSYAGLNNSPYLVTFVRGAKTQRPTLEQLGVVFRVSTKRYAAYQSRVWLPWWFKRNVF